eukprot:3889133-Rhodomonas_salina.1
MYSVNHERGELTTLSSRAVRTAESRGLSSGEMMASCPYPPRTLTLEARILRPVLGMGALTNCTPPPFPMSSSALSTLRASERTGALREKRNSPCS